MRRLWNLLREGARPRDAAELVTDLHTYIGAGLVGAGAYWIYEPAGAITIGAFFVYLGLFHQGA